MQRKRMSVSALYVSAAGHSWGRGCELVLHEACVELAYVSDGALISKLQIPRPSRLGQAVGGL